MYIILIICIILFLINITNKLITKKHKTHIRLYDHLD
jgi:hypothetical protein